MGIINYITLHYIRGASEREEEISKCNSKCLNVEPLALPFLGEEEIFV